MSKGMKNEYTLNHRNTKGRTMELTISTDKRNGLIQSSCSIGWVEHREGWTSTEHAMFEDYFKYIKPSVQLTRATEKNIAIIHNESVAQLEDILHNVKEHYQLPDLQIVKQ